MKTTDPEVGKELHGTVGFKCQSCGGEWWDDELHDEMQDAETVWAVDEAWDGEECPHCGYRQVGGETRA